jgi:CubicO group peptidase (beta-lactamase class C family)
MNSTSGVMDYHYLGDPLEATYRTPKASDEVVGLFAGRGYTSESPGIKWDWSISNFALLVEILEKVTGSSYQAYLEKNIVKPLELKETHYLEEKQLLTDFARGYGKPNGDLYPTYQSLLTYDPSLRIGISTGDLFKIWDGIRNGKLISAKSYAMMTTPEGAGKHISQTDPTLDFGYILRIRKVGDQVVMGLHGALPGYSSHCYYFPQKEITIVVLANTSNQYANEIGQAIGLKLLGLPVPAIKPESKISLEDVLMSADEQKSLTGTYRLTLAKDNLRHDSYALYTRTLRVFVEHGQLEIQELGDSPESLLKQADGSYATASSPSERISFAVQNGKVVSFSTSANGKKLSTSVRVGDGDAATFHER